EGLRVHAVDRHHAWFQRHASHISLRPATRLGSSSVTGLNPTADIAVIGGSGLYAFLDDAEEHTVDTPFGLPSDPSTVASTAARRTVLDAAAAGHLDVTDGGAMVVIEGPRFSTRAESRWYTSIGGAVVNMTGQPEAVLARELALCYTTIALVTDLDAGVEGDHGVTQEEVFRVFAENTERLRGLLLDVVAALPTDPDCPCQHALDGLKLPIPL